MLFQCVVTLLYQDDEIYKFFKYCDTKENPDRTTGTTVLDNAPQLQAMEHTGDLLIRDIWHNGTDIVHDMRFVNTYARSHSENPLEKCLQEAKRAKKLMYLEACLQQRRHFSPFVSSFDVLMGVQETYTLKMISICLAKNWRQPYPRTCGYFNSRFSITLVRATHRCIQKFQGAGAQYKRPAPAVGRRLQYKPIQVSSPEYPNPNQCLHTIPTPQPSQRRRPKPAQVSLKRVGHEKRQKSRAPLSHTRGDRCTLSPLV